MSRDDDLYCANHTNSANYGSYYCSRTRTRISDRLTLTVAEAVALAVVVALAVALTVAVVLTVFMAVHRVLFVWKDNFKIKPDLNIITLAWLVISEGWYLFGKMFDVSDNLCPSNILMQQGGQCTDCQVIGNVWLGKYCTKSYPVVWISSYLEEILSLVLLLFTVLIQCAMLYLV